MFQTIKSRELIITILFYNVENAEMVVYRASIVWTLKIHSMQNLWAFIAGFDFNNCIFPYYGKCQNLYHLIKQMHSIEGISTQVLLNNFFTVLTSTVQECFLT